MPDTPIYAITYPASTDLVTNGATQMGTISTDVEAALQAQTASLSTGFRNTVENPTFSQNQRPDITTSVVDFWNYYVDAIANTSFTQNALTPVAGVPEWVTHYVTNATTSNPAGVARYVALEQYIEDVRVLSNTTVIVSFYAKAATGTPKVGVNLTQYFGTGGSPSADVVQNGQAVTISTSWARYSVTFTLPTIVGKTLGTNGNSATILRLWYSAGTNFNTPAGSIGLQTATIDITGVQVERSYLTPLEIRPIGPNFQFSSTFGTFDSWTPQFRQGAAGLATTVNYAAYTIVGRWCYAMCNISAGAAGTAGQTLRILSNGTLPLPKNTNSLHGHLLYDDIGTGLNWFAARATTGFGTDPSFVFYLNGGAGAQTTPTIAAGATPDSAYMQVWYEIA